MRLAAPRQQSDELQPPRRTAKDVARGREDLPRRRRQQSDERVTRGRASRRATRRLAAREEACNAAATLRGAALGFRHIALSYVTCAATRSVCMHVRERGRRGSLFRAGVARECRVVRAAYWLCAQRCSGVGGAHCTGLRLARCSARPRTQSSEVNSLGATQRRVVERADDYRTPGLDMP